MLGDHDKISKSRQGVYRGRVLELLSYTTALFGEVGLPRFGVGNKRGYKIKLYTATTYLC